MHKGVAFLSQQVLEDKEPQSSSCQWHPPLAVMKHHATELGFSSLEEGGAEACREPGAAWSQLLKV